MQKKTISKPIPSKRFLEFASRSKSWMPVSRNGWIIKFSSYRDNSILLFVVSQHTGQTIIRYFKDEDEACKFINLVIELNSQEEYDL
jgi:hypothetical protein